jgi:hypothetical protein
MYVISVAGRESPGGRKPVSGTIPTLGFSP